MNALWTSAEAATATGGTLMGGDWQAGSVSIDTRSLTGGDLFVALAGPNHDGHDWLAAAREAGAAAAIVRSGSAAPDGLKTLAVADTAAALAALGRHARDRTPAKIAAVTGSAGKTGTKEALALALGALGPAHASAGNLNNHWGAPLSLARMPAATEWGVFELGMSAPGELTALSRLVRPHVAIITTIAPAHLEHFASLDAIADAKAEIFLGIETGGTAILNRDDPYFGRLAAAARAAGVARILSFGSAGDADARLLAYAPTGDGAGMAADIGGARIDLTTGLTGRHWAQNILAVLAAVHALGGDVTRAAAALANLQAPVGRGRRVTVRTAGGNYLLIDDSYNANPASIRAALAVLGETIPGPGGRRIAVLGDMLELGPHAALLHAGLAAAVEASSVDLVFTAGPLMAELAEATPPALRGAHAGDAAALLPLVRAAVRAGDVVLVKGSNGSRMGPLAAALAQPAGTGGGGTVDTRRAAAPAEG
ncbi:MAG: UDP-N-acetylmuramoyl-tripeptide--D-alanyl-D-alanine ligase [Alphaproteobacteria bacterium]|nr:UDP-N-acetylmuramoyl-tripeptide--D-alanyl-D-alanine ligase [Alphaproteobacteria bacterium]